MRTYSIGTRVVSLERTNARSLTASSLPEPIDLAVIDVSFISLGLVLGPIAHTLRRGPDAPILALVKPQFEAGRGRTDHGVVRDPAIHRELFNYMTFCLPPGEQCLGYPVAGKGNSTRPGERRYNFVGLIF